MSKYIVLTGGVTTGIGKGIVSTSLVMLLENLGFKTKFRKLSPYINKDGMTLAFSVDDEPYVGADGSLLCREFSHYERFVGRLACAEDWATTGSLYTKMLEKDKASGYKGVVVRQKPHLVDEVCAFISRTADKDEDFVVLDLGGLVGDSELHPYFEALKQLTHKLGRENFCHIHMTLAPNITAYDGELVTKVEPTCQSVTSMYELGIRPDLVLCKLAPGKCCLDATSITSLVNSCKIEADQIMDLPELKIVYEVPLVLAEKGFATKILDKFGMKPKKSANLSVWKDVVSKMKDPVKTVTIGIVSKYGPELVTYLNTAETLNHAGMSLGIKVKTVLVDVFKLEKDDANEKAKLAAVEGMVVPGGFSPEGTETTMKVLEHARINQIPTLGVCLGHQMLAIEFARNVLNMKEANSTEFEPDTVSPVVARIGKLNIGLVPINLDADSKLAKLYKEKGINDANETFAHFWAVDLKCKDLGKKMAKNGMKVVAFTKDSNIVAALELEDHPWYVSVQYHPEMRSTPFKPGIPYLGLVKAVNALTDK